ncbi:prepilin-type N-terminal cleavage/methylation domain-containing protein [Pulveribacter sp.]|uniref:prepilin-type N-terminal cleavage/methylation domain-containing protein n=1 Tax=Pulveribacter sp. TaxID=2678893 RepID=UPI0028A9712B|nr:prepilin-type N-terminal cleavage/methylation domain-containing protein [Pulveribacter sp.]
MKCRSKAARSGGFTLVEMLVSMVLLSMIMVGMVSVMRSMGQSQDRVDLQLDAADDIRVSTAFLRATLGRVSARRTLRITQLGESPFEFSARPQELIWVGVMPARFGMGGRSYFRLALEPEGGGSALVLRFAPWNGQGPPDWGAVHAYKVASAVTSFAMSFEDARQPIPQWVDAWQRPDSLPARVRIALSTQTGPWPLWIVPMRQSPATQIGGSRFTAGGD